MSPHQPPDEASILARLDDAPRLLALRRLLREMALAPEPKAVSAAGPNLESVSTVALLPGSFNPPTVAHLALARAGLEQGADAVLFALATRTVDKEVVTGAALEDRLLLLEMIATDHPGLGALVVNRGLYVDQAEAVRAAFPSLREVVFLVGYDKIVQIFDPRYYDDRDAALERVFGLARLLVAPRAEAGAEEIDALLARPENQRFAPAVRPLDLPPTLRDVASSAVRTQAAGTDATGRNLGTRAVDQGSADGDGGGPGLSEQLPMPCRLFVAETSAYAPEPRAARYRRRLATLDALEELACTDVADDDLRARFRAAMEAPQPPNPGGQ